MSSTSWPNPPSRLIRVLISRELLTLGANPNLCDNKRGPHSTLQSR